MWNQGHIELLKEVHATHIENKVQILLFDCIRLNQGRACINCIAGMQSKPCHY